MKKGQRVDGFCQRMLHSTEGAADSQIFVPVLDLIIIGIYAIVLIVLAVVRIPYLSEAIPWMAAGIFIFIPGYLLLSLLFPKIELKRLAERIILSIGISAMLLFIVAFICQISNLGIRADILIVSLSSLSLLCSVGVFFRRYLIGFSPVIRDGLIFIGMQAVARFFLEPEGRTGRFASAVFAMVLLVLIMTTAFIVIMPKHGEKFTEFYILGPGGKAEDYPTSFVLGEMKPIIFGVSNHEYRNVAYDLVISINDSNHFTKIYSDSFSLADDQTIEKPIMLKPDHQGGPMRMEFQLYADGNMSAPYRELYLWVSVT